MCTQTDAAFFFNNKKRIIIFTNCHTKKGTTKKILTSFHFFLFFPSFFSILFAQKFDGDNLHWRVPFISSIKQTMCTCTYCACIHEHIYWNLAAWANLYDWTRAPKKKQMNKWKSFSFYGIRLLICSASNELWP